MSLLPVAEAHARLFALATPLPIETVPLTETTGRWLAEDITARRTHPAADISMMDGYAIHFADLPGPWTVIGESRAGAAFGGALDRGSAARIFTGAPVPPGADAILVQEEATRVGDRLHLSGDGPARVGANIRKRASDFAKGMLIAAAGDRVTPGRVATAAVGGHGTLPVRRKPRITLISTGDELVAPGEPAEAAMLPASNGVMLHALIGETADVRDAGIVPDRLDALIQALRSARADVIVTTGGASVGDHDLVRPALAAAGAELDFWRIAMRPGKPLLAGRLGETIILGLPGNPVSALVTAQLFLLPLIARLGGARAPLPQSEPAALAAPLPPVGKRDDYVRATLSGGRVTPLRNQESGAVSMLALADALIVRRAESPAASVEDIVDILRIA